MSTTTTVGPYTISVRAEHSTRFVTLYVGEIFMAGALVEKTAAVANYELARVAAVDEARARLTPDEFHDAGFCSADDHCGCIAERRCAHCGNGFATASEATLCGTCREQAAANAAANAGAEN